MDGNELKSTGGEDESPKRRRGRWIGAGAVAVAVIAIVAIVVASGGGGGPLNTIAKAAEVTQREPGGHATIDLTTELSTTPEGLTESGSMIFDESGRAEGTLTVRGHNTGREETVTVIGDGTTSYISSDSFDSIPGGKKWVEVEFASTAGEAGASAANGPREGLKVLEGVEDAEKLGQEDIDGVSTTHYRGTLPHPEEAFGVKVDLSDLHVDVWIDGQERVRRIQVSVKSAVSGVEGSAATTEMTIDYVSFGRVPKIELPPADEVFNATSEVESNLQSAAKGN